MPIKLKLGHFFWPLFKNLAIISDHYFLRLKMNPGRPPLFFSERLENVSVSSAEKDRLHDDIMKDYLH